MIVTPLEILSLIENKNYRIYNDLENNRYGIQYRYGAIFFPSILQRYISENSDDKGIYWINKKDLLPEFQLEIEKICMNPDNEKRVFIKPRRI